MEGAEDASPPTSTGDTPTSTGDTPTSTGDTPTSTGDTGDTPTSTGDTGDTPTSTGDTGDTPTHTESPQTSALCVKPQCPPEEGAALGSEHTHTSTDSPVTPPPPDSPVTPPPPPRVGAAAVVVQSSSRSPASEKLERVRKWSITTYKCTRQALAEKLGRGSRTVDLELEPRLELLRDDRQRYDHMTKLTQTLANQIAQLSVTQKALGDAFSELSVKTPTLHVEFGLNAEAQRFLGKSGETLSAAVNSFTSDMNTLLNKTIEDTMINAKQYDNVRMEYDAYRVDLEELNMGPRDPVTVPKLEQAQKNFSLHREKYEKSRENLSIKLKLLEENKVKVLQNQLWFFHQAVASHCLNSHRFLQNNILHNLPPENNHSAPSWLEES
ncbi:arfaptin-1-like isoform X2 [Boleophthalmus pectinirostris]|uniref:arfaptin-1-like isoform X2 n=1 Tax=Boleophthalmus pectinirostris TaxID=150288 RepID=UPI0024301C97|nr:arfaptin-1-like isoform X2 [Boleophthalmus pectinirostris]